jgi:hypothetical protein
MLSACVSSGAGTGAGAGAGAGAGDGGAVASSGGWWSRLTRAVSTTLLTILPTNLSGGSSRALAQAPEPDQHVVTPLLKPENATTFDDIYTNLRTIVPQQVMHHHNQRPPPSGRLHIDLLVHRPDHQFKKSDPGPADFCVCVCDFHDEIPRLAELEELTLAARPRQLKFAVVDLGTVTFYDLLDLQLTVYADYRGMEMVKPKKKNNNNNNNNNNDSNSNSNSNNNNKRKEKERDGDGEEERELVGGDRHENKRSRLEDGAAAESPLVSNENASTEGGNIDAAAGGACAAAVVPPETSTPSNIARLQGW